MTICAIATPLEEGGISVIRISGKEAFNIAEKIFLPVGDKKIQDMKGYTCTYGKIMDNDKQIDDGILTIYREPMSYTGENVAEISCHGGIYVTKRVLRLCLDNGAILADKGEFTKRALLNGKISLTQAESVMDIISAQGEYTLNSANLIKNGRLYKEIIEIKEKLVKILGELAAWVDYPEEDLPEVESESLRNNIYENIGKLKKILDDYDNGMILKKGIDTCIVGKPNVGKSTLMNMLLGYDRSIVTEIAGTTRDTIEEQIKLGEFLLKISDTAGIRETNDKVEKIGVQTAKKKIENSMLVLEVLDISNQLDEKDIEILEYVKKLNKKSIIILNKNDLNRKIKKDELEKYSKNIVEISAKNSKDRDNIKNEIEKIYNLSNYDSSSTIFANERQKNCVNAAKCYLEQALEGIEIGETLDAITVTIDRAAQVLMELTGEKTTEAVVEEVFSKFCVGK